MCFCFCYLFTNSVLELLARIPVATSTCGNQPNLTTLLQIVYHITSVFSQKMTLIPGYCDVMDNVLSCTIRRQLLGRQPNDSSLPTISDLV